MGVLPKFKMNRNFSMHLNHPTSTTPTTPYLLAAARLLVLAVTFVIMCEVAAGEGGAILRLALNV